MLSIATLWSVDSIQPGSPARNTVLEPAVGPALELTHEPTQQPRNAALCTGHPSATAYRAVTGHAVSTSTLPFGKPVSGRPERFRTGSFDLPRMSVV